MSYIGNPIISTDFPKDTFSGNGSTTAFTMSIAPASVNAVIVVVSGITQDPSTYTISGTTLTFSGAPPTGTSNISVRHLGVAGIPNVPSTGSVVTASIADSNVTTAKIADANITPAKLSTGAPTWDTSGRQFSPNQVCFSAIANSVTNATIVYSTVYVNIGSGLNTSTGIFTAPVAGTYMFTVNGLANGGSGDIVIQVNGTGRLACRGNNTTASGTLIYTLASGDTVKCVGSGVQIYGDNGGWSAFTGRLLG